MVPKYHGSCRPDGGFGSLGGAFLSLYMGSAKAGEIIPVQIFWNIVIWAAAALWFQNSREIKLPKRYFELLGKATTLESFYPALFALLVSLAATYFFRKGFRYYVQKGINRAPVRVYAINRL